MLLKVLNDTIGNKQTITQNKETEKSIERKPKSDSIDKNNI